MHGHNRECKVGVADGQDTTCSYFLQQRVQVTETKETRKDDPASPSVHRIDTELGHEFGSFSDSVESRDRKGVSYFLEYRLPALQEASC